MDLRTEAPILWILILVLLNHVVRHTLGLVVVDHLGTYELTLLVTGPVDTILLVALVDFGLRPMATKLILPRESHVFVAGKSLVISARAYVKLPVILGPLFRRVFVATQIKMLAQRAVDSLFSMPRL